MSIALNEPGAVTSPAKVEHTSPDERIQSIDALRGFDMLWISGGGEFLHTLAVATSWTWAIAVAGQFEHSRWVGCTFYDLIQPLFLFICGITLPLSIGRRMRRGQTRMQILRRLALRAVVLVILGQLDKNGPVSFDVAHIRFAGILQRIGVAGLAAGAIMMYARPRAQILWVIGILGGYGALMTFVPAPGQPAPSFEPGVNIVDYLDQHVMPGRLDAGTHDAEGWFSTPPAVASVLFGALAGAWLLSAASVQRRVMGLLGAGAVLVALGMLWGLQLPIIKNLFTSSYVVYTAGLSCLLLGLFYGVIDGLRLRAWAFPLLLIGMNPLLIYILRSTGWVDFRYIAKFFFGFGFAHASAPVAALCHVVATITVELLFLYWLYRRKLFWRI